MTDRTERRDGPRIDLRLRVRYLTAAHQGDAEASDVSPQGLRFETEVALTEGESLRLQVDAGDDEELSAPGHVTWCRARQSPAGKPRYDVGVALHSGWLAQQRGALGTALARIFLMENYEPARTHERSAVALSASVETRPASVWRVVDLSAGGMQLRFDRPLDERWPSGARLRVVFSAADTVHEFSGRIVWTAQAEGFEGQSGPELPGPATAGHEWGCRMGIQFEEVSASLQAWLEEVTLGNGPPPAIHVSRS